MAMSGRKSSNGSRLTPAKESKISATQSTRSKQSIVVSLAALSRVPQINHPKSFLISKTMQSERDATPAQSARSKQTFAVSFVSNTQVHVAKIIHVNSINNIDQQEWHANAGTEHAVKSKWFSNSGLKITQMANSPQFNQHRTEGCYMQKRRAEHTIK